MATDRSVSNGVNTLKIEAEEVVKEVAFAVKHVRVSAALPCSETLVYLNLETKENEMYCVELSLQGFQVVGKKYDSVEEKYKGKHYETIYSLLDNLSPGYRTSFGDTLALRLTELQNKQTARKHLEEN
ncbi:hypothetical protein ScPMuIL_012994 [Solemya velum]